MANQLKVAKVHSIKTLHEQCWAQRRSRVNLASTARQWHSLGHCLKRANAPTSSAADQQHQKIQEKSANSPKHKAVSN